MTRVRHCMVVHAYYPVGETRVQREAHALVDAGHHVDVLCLRGEGEPWHEHVDGVTVYRLPVRRHRGRGMVFQLGEYLAFFVTALVVLSYRHLRRRYDSVQVHNLPDFLVFCAVVPKLTGAAVILDIHDLMPEFLASRAGVSVRSVPARLVALQERLSCRFADRVITVTEEWRATLAQRSVPGDRIGVVMNLADPALFGWNPRERGSGDSFEVVYHGTFSHRYGVDLLLDAMVDVRAAVPAARLHLLGDGELRDELVATVRARGLEDAVTISDGMVEASRLPEALSRADVGVVPNRSDVFTEGILPTKLLELVATGTPVVVAETACVSHYFDDTMVSFFAPGDVDALTRSLVGLAKDRARLDELPERARRFNQDHSWESSARSYVELVAEARR